MDDKLILESLAMDLKRVSMGYHRGSVNMAKRFSEEVLKRNTELNTLAIKPYMRNILKKLPVCLSKKGIQQIAEEAQMYSTLLQNYCIAYL